MTAIPCGQKNRSKETIQSQTVTPPLAAMRRNNVQVENSNHKQQYQIETSEDAFEMGGRRDSSIKIPRCFRQLGALSEFGR